ncbi:MAG: glycosyltransferase family 39 protein, partial [Clostridia bacterium]
MHITRIVGGLLAVLALCCVGYLCFGNLGTRGIVDYDEARHGVNAYEMLRNGDYLVSTFAGTPDYWNLKPPLSYWCIALCYQLFGYTVFALRFYSAFFMMAATLALCLWMARRFGLAAAVAVVLGIAANSKIYANHFARFADADAQFQCLYTIAMLCMLQSRKNLNWLYGSAACFGLAFLSKSVHAMTIPMVCFVYLLCDQRLSKLTWKRFFGVLATGLAPILIWAIARYTRDGFLFFEKMFSVDVAERIASAESASANEIPTLLYYLDYMVRLPAVWGYLVISAFSYLLVRWNGKRLSAEEASAALGCALWAVVPVVLYILTDVKAKWYSYNVLLALPAMMAIFVQAATRVGKAGVVRTVAAVAAVGAMGLLTAFNVQSVARESPDKPYQELMQATFDRELDFGRHVYIQYNESSNGKKISAWMPADRLAALFYGDLVCMDGGAEAFEKDEESALLVMGSSENDALV